MCMSVHAANAAQGNLRYCETEEIADEFHKGCHGFKLTYEHLQPVATFISHFVGEALHRLQ